MALTHTDRGDTNFGESVGNGRTVTSASFTPAVGTLLTASGYTIIQDGGGAVDVFSISSTGFTTTAWTSKTAGGLDATGGYSIRSGVWTATVTSSASGTVVLTRPLRNGVDWWANLQVDEWAGHNGSGLGATADDALASGSTLTVGFGGTPTASSGAVGILGDNNGAATGAVQPSGWTESSDVGDASFTGNSSDAAWILTNAQASPQWTGLQSGVFGKIGSVLEILEAAAATESSPGRGLGPGGGSPAFQFVQKYGVDPDAASSNVNVSVGVAAVTATANASGAAVAHAVGNAAVTATANNATATPTTYVLNEDFPGSSIDTSTWQVYNRIGDEANSEVNGVIPANVRVSGGELLIDSKFEDTVIGDTDTTPITVHYTSGQIAKAPPLFTYGDVQVRAKIPGGTGTWPCIWMLGYKWETSQPVNANAPADPPSDVADVGFAEIDIAEFLSGHRTVQNCALHFPTVNAGGSGEKAIPFDATTRFMVYRVLWTPTTLTWYIDAEDGNGWVTLLSMSGAAGTVIPNVPMYLIIHTAIGGVGGTPDSSTFPVAFEVDYARIIRTADTVVSTVVYPECAAVTATGNNVTVSAGSNVNVSVGSAAVSATANNSSASVKPTTGNAAVTATANNSSAAVASTIGTAAVTSTANNADHQIAPTIGTAAVTVTGNNATVSTSAQTNVSVGVATVTAAANDSGAAVAHAVGNAAVTATGNNVAPTSGVNVTVGVATVTATANNASHQIAAAVFVAAVVAVLANNAAVDNGEGAATFVKVFRSHRPRAFRTERPDLG